MEIRKSKILFGKNGNGYVTTRITLPVPWVRALHLSEENRDAVILFDNATKEIIIKKQED